MNELISANNLQVQINDMLNVRIQKLVDTIEEMTKQSLLNNIIMKEYETILFLLNVESLNSIILEIQDAILKAKAKLPYNKLLSFKEKLLIESIIQKQAISTSFPEEALAYVTTKIATKKDILLYIIEVPQLETGVSDIITIHPLIINGTRIVNIPTRIIKTAEKLYTTSKPNDFVQYQEYLQEIYDECSVSIIQGKVSHCHITNDNNTLIDLIAQNKVLINNAYKLLLRSDCEPHDRYISGNSLLTFSNCSVTLNNRTFVSKSILSTEEDIQGAFLNLEVNRSLSLNLQTLKEENMIHRKMIDHLKLSQYEHKNWILSIIGGLSITTTSLIILIAYMCLCQKKIVRKHRCRKHKNSQGRGRPSSNPGEVTQSIAYDSGLQ
ncbi:uncharacterized protein LOC133393551 [Anopheles gambiae]|uniref:uncharacterized protein LOC133393551 n=1 Tax=Anopheles gambiae TaxID=7165 RepID=UPI002AC8AAE7|nr:uncharacterized protein LOC133393551 [Anopheles gambiae]